MAENVRLLRALRLVHCRDWVRVWASPARFARAALWRSRAEPRRASRPLRAAIADASARMKARVSQASHLMHVPRASPAHSTSKAGFRSSKLA